MAKRILVVAQLALGDSHICKTQFLDKLSPALEVTVLCNEYNKFIFDKYDTCVENWPIARNRPIGTHLFNPTLNPGEYESVVLPSAHLLELLYARVRFKNRRLLVPCGKQFAQMQKNHSRLSYKGLERILIDASNWYELYQEFAEKVSLKFVGVAASKTNDRNSRRLAANNIKDRKRVVVCPHSNTRVKYKWLPDTLVMDIIERSKIDNAQIIIVSDQDLSKNLDLGQCDIFQPSEAISQLCDVDFDLGFFCDSFLSHFFANNVHKHYVYDSGVDRFHVKAKPPYAVMFDNISNEMWS